MVGGPTWCATLCPRHGPLHDPTWCSEFKLSAFTLLLLTHYRQNLFPDAGSCRDFARAVLQVCHVSFGTEASNGRRRPRTLEQQLDIIEREFSGRYHPECLFASQASTSRDSRILQSAIPSQTSTSQPTVSIESGSYTQSVYGTNTEISTPFESYAYPLIQL